MQIGCVHLFVKEDHNTVADGTTTAARKQLRQQLELYSFVYRAPIAAFRNQASDTVRGVGGRNSIFTKTKKMNSAATWAIITFICSTE